ncbi:mfs monocarboxylate [Moniliophthora roreri MCA 2997]|uniref:Mfs monocarboxylate n=1 Tax=Moniliophthora roreri (strain MCA 2997) TaxID=1381753 RepID=V2XQ48_MONRO|nr:mfs monocarboxylate [Moniliophthora roreri MCA 2997]
MSGTIESKGISNTVAEMETLEKRGSGIDMEGNVEGETAISLPPTDSGFHAWAYLTGAWILDFIIWGLPQTYGVFFDFYLSSDPSFINSAPGLIALAGSLCNGILYLSSLILLPVITRYPQQKTTVMIVGLIICVSGLVGAAFATTPGQLILTQGVMYSVGGSFLYFPMMTYLFEWFKEKKGIANGILFSGSSLGGVVISFVVQVLLRRFGRKVTLLSLAISSVILIVPCFPFLKPRQPIAYMVAPRPVDFGFLKRNAFWVLCFANLSQGLGVFMPFLYLPKFASDLNLSTTYGALSVSLVNGFSAPGLIFFGHLSDRFDLRISILLSSVGSALSVFLLWGFSNSIAPFVLFACVYGFLGPSWSALFPRFVSASIGDDPRQSSVLFSLFLAGRGVGNTLSASVSVGLLHLSSLTDKSIFGYGLKGYVSVSFHITIIIGMSTWSVSGTSNIIHWGNFTSQCNGHFVSGPESVIQAIEWQQVDHWRTPGNLKAISLGIHITKIFSHLQ